MKHEPDRKHRSSQSQGVATWRCYEGSIHNGIALPLGALPVAAQFIAGIHRQWGLFLVDRQNSSNDSTSLYDDCDVSGYEGPSLEDGGTFHNWVIGSTSLWPSRQLRVHQQRNRSTPLHFHGDPFELHNHNLNLYGISPVT